MRNNAAYLPESPIVYIILPKSIRNRASFTIFVDKCSVEIFLDGGKVAMTNLVFPNEPYNRMSCYAKGGSYKVNNCRIYRLGF